ncbi:MAG: MBL fold metallo-hydrolase [Syntrophomonadaceae bacterium]|nr:MBL fold metallo-hydrolase [Syntrophomonadaceae bacterium]
MLKPISSHLFWIEAPYQAKYLYSHSMFIAGSDVNVLVDTCCGEDNLQQLKKNGIDIVLNSHFHEDHTLNNPLFEEAVVWAHTDDAPAMRSLDVFADYYGFNEPETIRLGEQFIKGINLQPSKVDRELLADEILDFGGVKLHVIHTPGHTPGHCCFYEEKNGVLFLGDIDLSGFGPWYAHQCSDIDDFIVSIKKCLLIDPAIALSSHKGLFTGDIKPFLQKYLDKIFAVQDLILESLKVPRTLDELTDQQMFYGKSISLDPLYRAMEKMAINLHLERLIRSGQIEQSDNLYYLSK